MWCTTLKQYHRQDADKPTKDELDEM